jgi:hypothetical protein
VRALGVAARPVRYFDHLLGRLRGRLSVLVDVRTPMNLAVLRPVWRRLHDDSRVTLRFTAEDADGVARALAVDRLADRLMPQRAVRWRRWDLAISADAWNDAPLFRCRSRLNFFHGVAGKYDLDDPRAIVSGISFNRFDRVAFINDDRLAKWVAAGAVTRQQAVLVGFPKLDDVVNDRWGRERVLESLGLDPSRRTLLYAPTFSTAGSLHIAGEAIVKALLASGANVIVKLHDRSIVPSVKHTAGIDWRVRFHAFAGNPRFNFAEDADAGPLLTAADLLVTDHSSIGFEFALLDRPVVVFDAPDLRTAARVAADKWDLLRSMATVVGSADALGPAVATALANQHRLREARAAARELFAFPGRATDRAMAVIYELLSIEAPASRPPATGASGYPPSELHRPDSAGRSRATGSMRVA